MNAIGVDAEIKGSSRFSAGIPRPSAVRTGGSFQESWPAYGMKNSQWNDWSAAGC